MSANHRLPGMLRHAFCIYEGIWRLVIPWLRHHTRISEGYPQRTLQTVPDPVDLWIQSASVGESYLSWELLSRLNPSRSIRVLTTANTRQGIDVLNEAKAAVRIRNPWVDMQVRYFPFDQPSLMVRILDQVRPGLMVLLETELWPGLLFALKWKRIPSMVVNGRMSVKSVTGYRRWPALWHCLGPDRVLAVSGTDAGRFGSVFPGTDVSIMHNIKFDRLHLDDPKPAAFFGERFLSNRPFLVLGSVRREEEDPVHKLILRIRCRHPETVIGLFPRHLHRVASWKKRLKAHSVPLRLRSEVKSAMPPGTVVLWDRIGELNSAYSRADAAFVGGSLAPVGGQNFLEPLMCGIRPVIGPFWDNFKWVGADIFDQGLVRVGPDWESAADLLSEDMKATPPRDAIREQAGRYIRARQGGARSACRAMEPFLNGIVHPMTQL